MDPSHSIKVAKLSVNTGILPLKESVYGKVIHTIVPRKFKPVEEYLREQARFVHIFKPERQEEVIKKIQESVDGYWRIKPARVRSKQDRGRKTKSL